METATTAVMMPSGDSPEPSRLRCVPSDRALASGLAACFVVVAVCMVVGWGWHVPSWQDLPSVRLDLALNGGEATLAIRAEATEPAEVTNQVRIFHETNEQQLIAAYPLSDALSLGELVVVPGLANTLSYNALDEVPTVSRHMVPQGIAVSERWVFISAYDGAHDANSVIYLIDRSTGLLAKTVVLSGQPHVGGLAFDDEHNRLWICGKRGSKAQLAAIDLEHLEAAEDGSVTPVSYDQAVLVHGPKRASFVEYYDGSLYVGFFNATDNGHLYRYLLDERGRLGVDGEAEAVESWDLPPCAQGVALGPDQVMVSLSHGNQTSELLVFDRDTRYDYMVSLPAHGGRTIFGTPPEWPGGEFGSGSAVGSLAMGVEAFTEGVSDDSANDVPEQVLPDEEGQELGLPTLAELFPGIFGGIEVAVDVGDEEASTDVEPESAVMNPLEHDAFAEGLAVMAADRAAIGGVMATGMAAKAEELAASGEHAVREVVSYAEDPVLTAELPPMMEDLTIRDGLLFAVYESGAAVYRNRYGVGVDRVVAYPLSLIDAAQAFGVSLLEFGTEDVQAGGDK